MINIDMDVHLVWNVLKMSSSLDRGKLIHNPSLADGKLKVVVIS